MRNEEATFAATDTGRRIPEASRHREYARQLTFLPGGHGISGLRQQYAEPLFVLLTGVVGLGAADRIRQYRQSAAGAG